ncbi:SEC-C metal-binding domain-containing protein [Halobacillus litoralis]|uniref:SEC-C domain-containing protein n=1 Tax=Halobacillus litoralis TaxID=45668 RepID=A0A410MG35_9BACI|nr:SEC-C metal-binding domain-containing protein [Halobacillus litoralis]QAS53681.1 hypothetical protein HLI_16455 [Halobacillus litoralis]
MSKIKRNDPCPCGSGKKYKKCCMNKNDDGAFSTSLHEELNTHYSHFMAYVNRNYPNLTPAENKESQEEEIEVAFRLVQSVFIEQQKNKLTIYEEFLDKKKEGITRPATLASLEDWKSPVAGVFEIKQPATEQTVMVEDVWSNESYEVNRDGIPLKEENYAYMPYCIGVLLKWGSVYNFIPLAIPNYASSYQSFREKVNQDYDNSSYTSMKQYMQATLIEQLKAWLYMNTSEDAEPTNTGKTNDDEVVELLDTQMEDELTSSDSFRKLKKSWQDYKEEQQPAFRKPEVVAAALEHIYRSTTYFRDDAEKITKKEVATKYEVSPSSMSNRINKLQDFFEEK